MKGSNICHLKNNVILAVIFLFTSMKRKAFICMGAHTVTGAQVCMCGINKCCTAENMKGSSFDYQHFGGQGHVYLLE